MEVPYIDLAASYRGLQHEIDAAVKSVLAGGSYVLGENLTGFEEEFARWIGPVEAAGVGSGTDAIYLTLKALDIGPGDEVITVSHTAVNTALAVSKCGAVPVLVDIDDETLCMDPAAARAACGGRTRAILPVHLYGHPADLDPLARLASNKGLALIEDCAQAHGAEYKGRRVGTTGLAGCFSFYPTKNLGACGDAGAVVSRDPDLISKIRSMANCGQGAERYVNINQGDVSRLDELQAAILRVKLKALDRWTERRRAAAAVYGERLAGVPGLQLPVEKEWARHVYHLYVVRSRKRTALQTALAEKGIRTLVHYPVPVHKQPAYAGGMPHLSLPVTEKVVGEILSIPCFPEISDAQLEYVADSLKSLF